MVETFDIAENRSPAGCFTRLLEISGVILFRVTGEGQAVAGGNERE